MTSEERKFHTVVYEDTHDKPKIVATCQGDAMAERDELEKGQQAYNAVISYMLGKGYMESPLEFLRCWNSGDFDSLRKEWPDAPPEIYYADPLNDK